MLPPPPPPRTPPPPTLAPRAIVASRPPLTQLPASSPNISGLVTAPPPPLFSPPALVHASQPIGSPSGLKHVLAASRLHRPVLQVLSLSEFDDGASSSRGGPTPRPQSSGRDFHAPADTTFYDLLGVPYDASTDQIKKVRFRCRVVLAARGSVRALRMPPTPRASFTCGCLPPQSYYKKALKLHPDKNPDNEEAKAQFQALSEAYQVTIEPDVVVLRRRAESGAVQHHIPHPLAYH